ncbi:L-piperidine-6-carboxylate dehydrogenase [Variovorax sp. PBL-E5]|uniref:L-piperidine-6-carboxylate dehydrogenase n=1 Tax=Variovorax sp. PBL-E5 TaxID=434014 RepID=UPI001315B9E3|nr:aldehyde dehydrogenase family protein [Variovorax sp. PBL-E5]VTU34586.1 Succinate-semialdehyde dehydrogenase [NADP(+)] GabD [Variovorax sp. PBL-E5]
MTHADDVSSIFQALGIGADTQSRAPGVLEVRTPIDGSVLARIEATSPAALDAALDRAHQRFLAWREVPAPKRGELVRAFGAAVRRRRAELGRLITLETGKILQEGLGEVQEVIDICEFAVGLSRQLYGLTIASERPEHKLLETWQPLGLVGIISAFNFPMAVFSWNAAIALVCGNTLAWKPSEKTPLSAVALNSLMQQAAVEAGLDPAGLSELLIGERSVGEALVAHPKVRLVSATGSTAMGRKVAVECASRFKRSLLELGGNNAAVVGPSADLELVVRGVAFAAAGTAGQRCTSLRRLIVHRSIYAALVDRLVAVFARLPVGDPLEDGTLVGPLIDERAFAAMQGALADARALGAKVHFGEPEAGAGAGHYVRPAIVEFAQQTGPMLHETFAPILYVVPYDAFDDAIAMNNAVAHGLSSAVFTRDLGEAERFTSAGGSDCGIANVNIGTSGAEIGGAFGGEKETGGGRESGSDAWRAYMRRATNTINYGSSLPLAQGVKFDLG